MSTQTKSKLYLLIIGILLITNIGMLFFFLGNKDGGKKPGNRGGSPDRSAMMKSFLKDSIGFNDEQLQQYDTLSKQHRENAKAQFDSLKNSKEEQFKQLGNRGFSDSAIADMIKNSVEKQKAMELQLLNHFAAIRKICTAGQQPKFDSLFYKIWSKKKKPEEKK
ncbi:Spy/CpxP family protein refolding chaperone [Ferruginibacter sp. SUN106]|uniref:Spy/CpxP family protein refolding chaperone n=1 Tax=Ferruginibacter sp. SUN106 TaxID=2978348 RepID=UPI003D368480